MVPAIRRTVPTLVKVIEHDGPWHTDVRFLGLLPAGAEHRIQVSICECKCSLQIELIENESGKAIAWAGVSIPHVVGAAFAELWMKKDTKGGGVATRN